MGLKLMTSQMLSKSAIPLGYHNQFHRCSWGIAHGASMFMDFVCHLYSRIYIPTNLFYCLYKSINCPMMDARWPKKARPPQGDSKENRREGDEGERLDMGGIWSVFQSTDIDGGL
jgi:hypothetical protein